MIGKTATNELKVDRWAVRPSGLNSLTTQLSNDFDRLDKIAFHIRIP